MGQIVRRKKKGRPSKADLARRAVAAEQDHSPASERDLRRSVRRRNVRYNFDIDDYVEEEGEDDDEEEEVEEEEEDDEEETRREKKLKLVLKLQSVEGGGVPAARPSQSRRLAHATSASASSSDCEGGPKPLKKRKIDGDDEIEGDADDDDADDVDNNYDEARGRKTDVKGSDSVPGTPSEPSRGIRLPDKKSLELMLDKLQKKDTYGVYAEPVDPEELPDYHDVIEHPMDFATVRKKLANGLYSSLEQFEGDVLLICTNAMQYNAPDTIYHKQARSIQELAKKKFERIRTDIERSDKEIKSELNTKSNFIVKKQIKKTIIRNVQEPVGSDFSSGATLATAGDIQHGSNGHQPGGYERPSNVFGILEGNSSFIDGSIDKSDDLSSGKGLLSKFGRKQFVHEENRRATYNISNQPSVGSESTFSTFDSEIKQLVAVGLHTDHSYSRSLARFAATLGSVAWKVASQKIEQALPQGFKYGRGWVGEYEPLPTPVLMLENCTRKESDFLAKLYPASDARSKDKNSKMLVTGNENSLHGLSSEGKSSLFAPGKESTVALNTITLVPSKEQAVRGVNMEGKPSFFATAGPRPTITVTADHQEQRNQQPRDSELKQKVSKQLECGSPPSSRQSSAGFVAGKQILNSSEMSASGLIETMSRNRNILHSVPFNKQPEVTGAVAGALPNGEVLSLDRNQKVSSSCDNVPNQMVRAANFFPHGLEQGLSDPVKLMRVFSENAQRQQKSLNHSVVDTPSITSSRRDDSTNAAAAAARAWMSIGAGGFKPGPENSSPQKKQISGDSLYSATRDIHPQVSRFRGEFPVAGMPFQHEKNISPLQAFVTPPVRMGNEAQLQNKPVVFPQFVTADLSRFQVQSPRQSFNSQMQPRQKQESLPPDLNIGFQSSGSPVRQSSGVLVDSQQPDLALQL